MATFFIFSWQLKTTLKQTKRNVILAFLLQISSKLNLGEINSVEAFSLFINQNVFTKTIYSLFCLILSYDNYYQLDKDVIVLIRRYTIMIFRVHTVASGAVRRLASEALVINFIQTERLLIDFLSLMTKNSICRNRTGR